MLFDHLFIFASREHSARFFIELESMIAYNYFRGERPFSNQEIRYNTPEGQHRITCGTPRDLEDGRLRGRLFDKISIHEAVEMTRELHEFVMFNSHYSRKYNTYEYLSRI